MIHIGTSGFQYGEWRGSFYPADLSKPKMLSFYASHFSTTEINYTFNRLPSQKTLDRWNAATPNGFVFAFKAPKRITHIARLQDCRPLLKAFAKAVAGIGPKCGPVLFQLPPSFKKDLKVLREFLKGMPTGLRAAFEFRHNSWHTDDVFAALRKYNAALCFADTEDLATPLIPTASFAYFRLRHEDYKDADLRRWTKAIRKESDDAREVYVYFKHEETAAGVAFAQRTLALLRKGPQAAARSSSR